MKSLNDFGRYNGGHSPTFQSGRIATGTSRPRMHFTNSTPTNSIEAFLIRPNYAYLVLMIIGLMIALLFVMPTFPSSATTNERNASAVVDGGLVNILRVDSGDIEALGDGAQANIQLNDMISAEGGTATLRFFNDQLVQLSPNARLTVERYESGESGRRLEYMVWAGQVRHESHRETNSSDWVQISTPSSNVSIRNATILIHVESPEETVYQVEDGIAWVTMGTEEIFLTPTEQLVAKAGQPLVKSDLDQLINFLEPATQVSADKLPPTSDESVQSVADIRSLPSLSEDLLELASATEWTYHVVQPGESFWTIAAANSVPLDVLGQANPEIVDRSVLPIGHTVRIPADLN